jgi:PHP family Zn ribbon phosphoesterase
MTRAVALSVRGPCGAAPQLTHQEAVMFKVEAKRTQQGNYNVATTCQKGHTSYKKAGDTSNKYKCPYCGFELP